MRNKRALLIALLLGGLAVLLMYVYTQKKINNIVGKYEPKKVVIAAKPIYQNTIIDESMLEYQLIPKPFVEPEAILSFERATNYVSAINMLPGEQITNQKLIGMENRPAAAITGRKRAFTLSINEITGVGGHIRPGNFIDIVGIFKTVDKKTGFANNAEAVTVMQNVKVLSVGRYYMLESVPIPGKTKTQKRPDKINFSNVTVEVTPRQAMKLALAQELGTISLTLRSLQNPNPIPDKTLKNKRVTPQEVTGIKKDLQISPAPRWLEQRGGRGSWSR